MYKGKQYNTDFISKKNNLWIANNYEDKIDEYSVQDGNRYLYDASKMRVFDTNEFSQFMRMWICLEWMKQKLKDEKQVKILDLGCSYSQLYRLWVTHGRYFNHPVTHYLGVDIDSKRVIKGKREMFVRKRDTVGHIINDVTSKYKYGKFDVVVCMEVLEHLPKKCLKSLIKTIKLNLKKDGVAILSSPNPSKEIGEKEIWGKFHIHEWSWNEWETALNNYKLSVVNKVGVYPKNNFKSNMNPEFKSMLKQARKDLPFSILGSVFSVMDDMSNSKHWMCSLKKVTKDL